MICWLTVLAILAQTPSLFVTAAQSGFVACVEQDAINKGGLISASFSANSRASCAAAISSIGGYPFSYWSSNSNECVGSEYSPVLDDYTDGVDPYGTCNPSSTDWQVNDLSIPYFQGCFAQNAPITGNTQTYPPQGSPNTADGCYQACKANEAAIYNGQFGGAFTAGFYPDQTRCECALTTGEPVTGTYVDCTPSAFFVWTNDEPNYNPSIYRKRADRLAENIKRNRPMSLCPAGLTPCGVVGVNDAVSFECIDTHTELESCGGCIGRDFTNTTSHSGVNCLDTVGVAPGGVTCSSGRCVSFACEDGYELEGASCVPRQ